MAARKRRKGTDVSRATERSFRDATKRIRTYAQDLDKISTSGLYLIGEEILTDIKDARPGKGVPVRDGHLRRSGRVTLAGALSGKHALVEISFGGAAAPYALVQHENLSFHHTIGEARYLVRGVERWSPSSSGAMLEMRRQADAAITKRGRK